MFRWNLFRALPQSTDTMVKMYGEPLPGHSDAEVSHDCSSAMQADFLQEGQCAEFGGSLTYRLICTPHSNSRQPLQCATWHGIVGYILTEVLTAD